MAKHTATDDEVVRRMELEEEQFANGHGLETAIAAGLPEIDFVGLVGRQTFKPVTVSDGDEERNHSRRFHCRDETRKCSWRARSHPLDLVALASRDWMVRQR